VNSTRGIAAISFDFYNTLAMHRDGRGRGDRVREFLGAHGWRSAPWEHDLLDELFAQHGAEYDPGAGAEHHRAFCERVTATLFTHMGVDAPAAERDACAPELWSIVGPDSLVLFPDAEPALARLKAAGYRLVITSNWHCGLAGFCRKLGVGALFEHVLASAEVGCAKHNRGIFDEVVRRLGVPANRIMHVCDSITDDWDGARNAGLRAILLVREDTTADNPADAITDLRQLAKLLTSSIGRSRDGGASCPAQDARR